MKTRRRNYSQAKPAKGLKIQRKKHSCRGCRICQHCADARCAVCRA